MLSFKEFLLEQKVDHSVAKEVAKHLDTKLLNFSSEKYKSNGEKIPGSYVYSFHKDVTHNDVHDALRKSGFKPPKDNSVKKDHEDMRTYTDSAVSDKHTARTSQEHGSSVKLHISER